MASSRLIVLSLALVATAQYPPQQPQAYYPYQQQQPSRADYGRAIVQAQPPYPHAFYQQVPPSSGYSASLFGPTRPEAIQVGAGYPAYGFISPLAPESIFRQGVSEQHRYLTPPSLKFKIGLVSDQHKGNNKDEDTGLYTAFLREANLLIQQNKENPETPNITLEFDQEEEPHKLESGINYGGRGFELSTLNVFNGKLYACDDITGVVYEIKKIEEPADEDKDKQGQSGEVNVDSPVGLQKGSEEEKEPKYRYIAQPWLILSNEGKNQGFKCEWGVVKDDRLWLGSKGGLVPKDPKNPDNTELSKEEQVVKVIDSNGEVTTLDWSKNYEKIAEVYDVNVRQGHVEHEAAAWSDTHQKWLFIPRRVTKEKKDDETWNKLGTNQGVLADELFNTVEPQKFGNLTESAGVVGLRFIPGTQDQFVLTLKTGEDAEGNQYSSLSVIELKSGKEVLPETKIGDGIFYEAVEFL